MRVLVTGGGGFLGMALVDALAQRGDTAIAFDHQFPPSMPQSANVLAVHGDITDPANITQLFKAHRPEAVIHCAAIVGVIASLGSPLAILRVNVEGSIHLLEAMRLFEVKRMLHISSEETYGAFNADSIDEEHAQRPLMAYGASKVATEHFARAYQDLHGIETIHLRTSWVYGAGLPRNRVPKNFIDAALAGQTLHVETGGDSRIDHTYIDDFVSGTLAALDHPRHDFDVYHIASGTAPTLYEVAEAVKAEIPSARIGIGPGIYRHADRIAIPRKGALDVTRAQNAFGWKPRFPIREGIAAHIRAAREVMTTRRTTP